MKNDLTFCEFESNMKFSGILDELLSTLPYQHCIKDDWETQSTTYRIYYKTHKEGEMLKHQLCSKLEEWKQYGIKCSNIVLSSIKNEDWAQVWKKFFKIIKVTPNLVVKASWLKYEPLVNEKIIEIDPEMSFGTGSHETTQFCLKSIERLSQVKDKSFLDAGSGSGILSIAAALYDFSPIYAFDSDKESLETILNNFKRNNIKEIVNFSLSDIANYNPQRQFGVVAANIISGVLIDNSARLKSYVKDGGYLILSGILKNDYNEVKAIFTDSNFSEVYSETERDWTGGIFQKKQAQSEF